jgi:hypothetical protein
MRTLQWSWKAIEKAKREGFSLSEIYQASQEVGCPRCKLSSFTTLYQKYARKAHALPTVWAHTQAAR